MKLLCDEATAYVPTTEMDSFETHFGVFVVCEDLCRNTLLRITFQKGESIYLALRWARKQGESRISVEAGILVELEGAEVGIVVLSDYVFLINEPLELSRTGLKCLAHLGED